MLKLETRVTPDRSMPPHAHPLITVSDGLEIPGFAMSFERDEEIYGEGEPAEFVYKVISGVVRTLRVLDDGRRQINAFHFTGEIFGLESGEDHALAAEAVTECNVALIRRQTLQRTMQNNSAAACGLWAITSRELERAQAHLMLLGRKTALERVATFLMEMAGRAPMAGSVNIPMSRTDIADYLGLTIETVSRTLSQLERSGAIALPSCRQITLRDRNVLSQLQA